MATRKRVGTISILLTMKMLCQICRAKQYRAAAHRGIISPNKSLDAGISAVSFTIQFNSLFDHCIFIFAQNGLDAFVAGATTRADEKFKREIGYVERQAIGRDETAV